MQVELFRVLSSSDCYPLVKLNRCRCFEAFSCSKLTKLTLDYLQLVTWSLPWQWSHTKCPLEHWEEQLENHVKTITHYCFKRRSRPFCPINNESRLQSMRSSCCSLVDVKWRHHHVFTHRAAGTRKSEARWTALQEWAHIRHEQDYLLLLAQSWHSSWNSEHCYQTWSLIQTVAFPLCPFLLWSSVYHFLSWKIYM